MLELFKDVKVDWLGKRRWFFIISIVLLLFGMASLLKERTFRYGVDFKGGTSVSVRFREHTPVDRIREILPKNSEIQEIAGTNEVLIEFEQAAGDEDATRGQEMINQALNKTFQGKFDILKSESVGPKVGTDLRRKAVLATLYALGGILVYIAFRFEWVYGAAAVFAVFHDTLVTLGLFSLFGKEINLTVIAALLTLVGYSVNDTIVVFDRVRENLKSRRRDDLETILNDSINQTLSRTILTSGLTFMTVVALFIFGGEVINNFAFAMVAGIIVGTYSSIAVASPLVLIYTNWRASMVAQPAGAARVPRAKAK